MRCPSCGDEMEPGYLVSDYPIYWCDHIPKFICVCGERFSTFSRM
ncbi:MAG: PF20097 family protein [Candidatus Thorarchaeota archaeon]